MELSPYFPHAIQLPDSTALDGRAAWNGCVCGNPAPRRSIELGINPAEVKSLSALRTLGNRQLLQNLNRTSKGSLGNLGSRPGHPRVKPMRATKSSAPVARFGAFEVAFESRELRKHGMRIRLEEKPFQILEALIESAGEVVKRKTLCEKLWPSTYVAFDHSLNTAVNKLRAILGDPAQTPRFIETRPRLGYCFVAPVAWLRRDRLTFAVSAASVSAGLPDRALERQIRPAVKATPVRGSSRRRQVQVLPLPAKQCQTAP